ncbi:LOW QUALITY PROTEIN: ciliogenesis and planar polarity effector 1 [Bufo gargarizans]|uniref:LOW QUALITY PROTEIN: ciliogenesis and planar polarity effector 1 n=1 Tax=Bufo gargarizans TaxID=30331 RepID=UPI001CF57FB5|nr:LOW QUALITY PROTEIN: ciliogenesis and planar polarity effector 1 [Bufo gargarizans]
MDVSLEVLLSTSIKRKKPCPRLCWLGQEKEGVFLVDERQVSEVKLRSGHVKRTLLKKSSIVILATSDNGAWLAALHLTGELSLWNKDLDCLQIIPANGEISEEIVSAQGNSLKLHLYVCDAGSRVLLATHTGAVYLWENTEQKPPPLPQKKRVLPSRWSKIEHGDSGLFPSATDKEATVHAIFIKNEVLGDCCLCAFLFYSGLRLVMTFLALQWFEKDQKLHSAAPYHVQWTTQDLSLVGIAPSCAPVKSRGSLLARFSRDGSVLTVALNQKDPKETRVLFINTMNFVTVCGSLRGCGSRDQPIPPRLLRSYWVADMSWTADSLFLACVLKRGSLLLLTRMGELLTLTTFGCSVEFGPAEFIPLHPFITYRPPVPLAEASNPNDSLGSVASEVDLMRQRYSVTCHPRLPYVMVSDGYMVTALRFAENVSPQNFMKSLLLDTAQRLENVRQVLQIGKSRKNGVMLRPLSSLKATLLKDPWKAPSTMSSVPSFLQEEEDVCGHLQKVLAQEDSEESDHQEDYTPTAPVGSTFSRAEQGRLEFASMFDTIHASDQYIEKSDVVGELLRIQRTILMAWAVGVSMGNVAQTGTLLRYTVGCLSHLLSILQNPKCPTLKSDKGKSSGDPWTSCVSVFHQCLTALSWDVAPRQTISHVIKLTAETLKLILLQHRQLHSKSLLEGFCLLKMAARSLKSMYALRFEAPATDDVAHGDFLKTPVFEAMKQPIIGSPLQCIIKEPPNLGVTMKSEKRLAVLWRFLYDQTLKYQTRLRKQIALHQSMQSALEVQNEEKAIRNLLCHIQAELQSGGGRLSGGVHLLPVNGEEYFLLGSYRESVEFWRKALQETADRGGRRSGLLQTRYYLAVLYCHLYHYNLTDAQGVCDQLVRELLIRSSLLPESEQRIEGDITAGQPLERVHPDAALAVIRSMGRFMAAYFTNQLLYVFPPHNVCVLPPLHASTDKLPRVVPLQHSTVACMVRDQNLSSVWTVEYTLDLLLVGGLMSEAAWLADKLGDWKMSVSMVVAYNLHRSSVAEEQKVEFPAMPLCLTPAHIFQDKLQSFLGHPPGLEAKNKGHAETKQFTDPIEEEDADILFSSVQEMLKAAVMADAEILTETLHQLMESAKELSGKLSGLVPERLYLPAPPLYCPQPSSVSEEDPNDLLLELEKRSRQKLSGVLQRILLLLRAAHCSLPTAQWYIKQIKRARKIMQKIRAKASLPPLESLPENLLNYANSRTVLLKPGPSGEPMNNLVSCSVIVCFRELCALCWMLHVRERLSISCRQYQKARDNGKLFKSADEVDSCVIEHCFQALEWACRMLPFTRAINCEELIQDLILSLISELPTVKKVAEIMVRAFPNPEDVRVSLREKYQSVQQRLRHSKIRGLHGEEMMSVIIHNMQRSQLKTLRRIHRNIGPVEMHMWEPPLDETLWDEAHCYDKFSLGTTSLSRSTLTDLGRPQIYSDTDTLSDALVWNGAEDRMESSIPPAGAVNPRKPSKAASKKPSAKRQVCSESGPSPPKVGTWEFECNDEEYTRFLDLFLSYLLERDLLHSSEPGIPFLTAFSPQLREHELNSLVFDVHTTLKRKLVRAGMRSVFRAGSCFTLQSESLGDSVDMEAASPQTQGAAEPSHAPCPTVVLGKPLISSKRSFSSLTSGRSVGSGLFGLQDQGTKKRKDYDINLSSSSLPSAPKHEQHTYRLIQGKPCTPNEELGEQQQAKYSREAKLVEWMIRWSDRRLFWSAGKAELCHVPATTAIRVKTSSAALLTSIWLLEKPYLGNCYIQPVSPGDHLVAPVIQSEVDSELQDRTSVVPGYLEPGRSSPYTVHERNDVSEEENSSQAASSEKRLRSPKRSPERHPVPQEKSQDGASESYSLDQISILSETEDDQEDEPETQRSVKIAVSIRRAVHEGENLSCESRRQDPEEPIVPERTEESQLSEPLVSAGCSSLTPQSVSSAAPSLPPPAANRSEPANPDGNQNPPSVHSSEAVRQLLQDEMFKLLQLQQINFMSLMQVVGSSFAAMPALQHVLEQTSLIGRNPTVNPTSDRQVINPVLPANTAAAPVADTPLEAEVVQTGSADTAAEEGAKDGQRSMKDVQRLPELSIPAHQEQKIPARMGLLITVPHQGLPLITLPSGPQHTTTLIRLPATTNQNGFPLLKLQPEPQCLPLRPPLREAWAPQSSSQRMPTPVHPPLREAWAPQSFSQRMPAPIHLTQPTGASDPSRKQKSQKWAELVSRGPPRHHSHQQPQVRLLGSDQIQTGMPLLHLRSDPVLYIPPVQDLGPRAPALLHLSKDFSDPCTSSPLAKMTLLKTNLPQQVQIEAQRRDPGVTEESLQRVKTNIQPSEDVAKAGDSMKRKNRRTLKDKNEKKASVKFRGEDSIIAPNNLDEVTRSEIVHHDKQDLEDGNEFVIPFGSFESMLSHQIPEAPISSMAELHFIASTMKRPPEIRDASTNTDSASKNVKDKCLESEDFTSAAVVPDPGSVESHTPLKDSRTKLEEFPCSAAAVSHSAPELLPPDLQEQMPPQLFLNLQYPDESEEPLGRFGHRKDGEKFPDSARQDLPSAAELHYMAASATRAAPLIPEDVRHGDILDMALTGDYAADQVTHHVRSSDLTLAPRVWTPRVRSNEATSRLKEMDAQLQALQNMADGMEHDFANTKLLVNTLETLTSAVQMEPKDAPSRGDRPPQRVLPLSDIKLEDLTEEDEYNLTSPVGIGSRERPLEALISSRGDGDHTTALRLSEAMDESTVWQDALQMTGLSDIADIVGDLLDGGASASELGLTPAQAEKLSRARLQGTSKRTPRERADLLWWMKTKQRERLAEHRRRLQELREKEHKPFVSQQAANPSKTTREMQHVKGERDRSLLSEHHSHRVSDAIGLMQEMLSEAKQIPSAISQPNTPRVSVSRHQTSKSSPKGARGAGRSLSANQEKRRYTSRGGAPPIRSTSTPARTQIRGSATFVLPKSNWEPKIRTRSAPSYAVHRRYDPSLPGDRLSQITRRGILTARNTGNSKSTKPILMSAAKQTSRQDKSSKGTSPMSQYGEFQLEEEHERDIVSPWEIPDDINRILNRSRNSILSQGSLINGEADSKNLNLDNSSESTGSILSKLDWKAIEDMVANVGGTEI